MRFTLPKGIWAGLAAISLATLPLALPAAAQTDPTTPTTTTDETYEDGFDWGWLGLLGLIGLAGLTRKPERAETYRETTDVSRPRL